MHLELWDTQTGNLIETFADEQEALSAVRELTKVNQQAYPTALELVCEDPDGRVVWEAHGAKLLKRALASETASKR
jgi:hypothetical protein